MTTEIEKIVSDFDRNTAYRESTKWLYENQKLCGWIRCDPVARLRVRHYEIYLQYGNKNDNK